MQRAKVLGAGLVAVTCLLPGVAAAEISFGANDVATVFFINKSDDHNRVDYGIRLDRTCSPVNDDAVFPYWREFENSPPVRTHGLNFMDKIGYGIADQKLVKKSATGGVHTMKLKQLNRTITITTKLEADGKCSATGRTTVGGQDAQLLSVYVKLAGAMSVDYIEIHGLGDGGAKIDEKIKK